MGTMKSKRTQHPEPVGQERKHSWLKRPSFKSFKREYDLEPPRGFIVRFAGKSETASPGGQDIEECLEGLYKKVRDNLDSLPRVCLHISPKEIIARWIDADQNELLVPFTRISFVAADRKHQLFAFKDFVSQKPRKVECYAFICNESEKSEVIANALSNAFREVYERSSRKPSISARNESEER